ncbi:MULTISPECIES: TetR/AcrR family transcriptional regulator [Gordonia]|uniref:TetR family transcriptional regulator n=1 Tax=Gordonia alkanivorans CGMCC 6845 TaxID=1423140 RepID=W9D8D7_9ACTN|nr:MULTISPECIES: TetR/AcrR family transcriptional regulator [Gordonia]ETA04632.1 TetR family transcriptional regulator [Gordonia alkanivorans CGMCC 6845]MDH3008738.1 TetR/AcrR family transcriptional regulator [Gordonia alkanivorans]MDH3012649.1 TetR/AcrR family transcriptional regulator [Gordonia alkanivorans]MDH3017693.1 TetR/AcrR family transcriptional regulator [Gordonia alkanivorans]MDH3022044.1 TetR/AcrR family transcriptional regulator [Gordonia alkanivorans]
MKTPSASRAERTGQKILDAAMTSLLAKGLKRTSIEAIAALAGVSHMTVYRRWPHKEDLFSDLLSREADELFARVDRELAGTGDPRERLIEGFAAIFWSFYDHPLLAREYAADPATTLRVLTVSSAPVFDRAVDYLAARVAGLMTGDAPIGDDEARRVAEVMVRITHSLLLTTLETRPFANRGEVGAWGREHVGWILFSAD